MSENITDKNVKPKNKTDKAVSDTAQINPVKTTLEKLGFILPIGYIESKTNILHKDFEFKEWTWTEEKKLSKLRKSSKKRSAGSYVSSVLSLMLVRIGDIDFQSLEQPQKELILAKMYMSDILYMFVCLRFEAIDQFIRVNLECPSCGHEEDGFPGDLNSVEVFSYDLKNPTKIEREVELTKGITLNNTQYKIVYVRPALWQFMLQMKPKRTLDEIEFFENEFKSSVYRIKDYDHQVRLTPNIMDTMIKKDISKLSQEIDKVNAGALMQINTECESCEGNIFAAFEWGPDFFEVSSQ